MNTTDRRYLSEKRIPSHERLVLALDVESAHAAKQLVKQLGDSVTFYKLGLQLWMADGYYDLIDWLHERKKKCLVDLKFFDVPETVASAVRQLRGRDVAFATVHGNEEILRAACREKDGMQILAVTVLTSLDNADLRDFGIENIDVAQLVLSRARRALAVGCDGVISSGLEARELRSSLGHRFLIVVPGIRPVANVDDQKRTVDVEDAFLNGADYIVVGRPIRHAEDPKVAADDMQNRIRRLFE